MTLPSLATAPFALVKTLWEPQTLSTAEEAKSFEGEAEAVVIGLFANVESDQAKVFLAVADDIDRLPFAMASGEEVGCDLRKE